ncbi:hypothetical protein OGAPHI_006739 [Ogataea philodendri]|uniref:RNA helicase n=1 Tax=Ogataea philodendri TaxID=1378263 RepID=A0A9P8NY41_9ASCO|nr:uncharacterized protein OGAPHI_006739 [Ogataea philodendri]KAH3661332.1 hypothetical protein OGAPHI_006739 [Ogataea philodendri]
MSRIFVRHLSKAVPDTKDVIRTAIETVRNNFLSGKPFQYPLYKTIPNEFVRTGVLFESILTKTKYDLLQPPEEFQGVSEFLTKELNYNTAKSHIHFLVRNQDKLDTLPIKLSPEAEGRTALQRTIENMIEKIVFFELRPHYILKLRNNPANYYNYDKKMSIKALDLSNPCSWYPEARKLKRKIVMHVGPTNSGKTFNALKKLEASAKGYYAGPLRLLAREVYEKFQSKGIRCNLMTGEEVLLDADKFGNKAGLTSGTIEMIPLNELFDIVVVDEIQMIGDQFRGSAWTNVILGARAKEIHLCGEVSAVPLVERLVALTGDDIEVNNYNRLGKLVVDNEPISLDEVQPGDCVVAFSKKQILNMKVEIEKETKLKCAVIYGALPPETRSEEARLFNEGKYDVVVASDAIGMGLNLKINRVVFTTLEKYDGRRMTSLSDSSVKQIGGRAGRFGVGEGIGHITAMSGADLRKVDTVMKAPFNSLDQAVIWPTDEQWVRYHSMFPKGSSLLAMYRKFEADMEKEERLNSKDSLFSIQHMDEPKILANFFDKHNVTNDMSISDQLKFVSCPSVLKIRDSPMQPVLHDVFKQYMFTVSKRLKQSVIDFDSMPLYLTTTGNIRIRPTDPKLYNNFSEAFPLEVVPASKKQKYIRAARKSLKDPRHGRKVFMASVNPIEDRLSKLEQFHRLLTAYLWLSYRFPRNFVHLELAAKLISFVEKKITEMLDNVAIAKQLQSREI